MRWARASRRPSCQMARWGWVIPLRKAVQVRGDLVEGLECV